VFFRVCVRVFFLVCARERERERESVCVCVQIRLACLLLMSGGLLSITHPTPPPFLSPTHTRPHSFLPAF